MKKLDPKTKILLFHLLMLAVLLLGAACFMAIRFYTKDMRKITSEYSEDTKIIKISVTKPHPWFDSYYYEVFNSYYYEFFKGDIVSLVRKESNDTTDVFYFTITGCGFTTLLFVTNNPKEEHDTSSCSHQFHNPYKYSYVFEIVITENMVHLNGRLWHR